MPRKHRMPQGKLVIPTWTALIQGLKEQTGFKGPAPAFTPLSESKRSLVKFR